MSNSLFCQTLNETKAQIDSRFDKNPRLFTDHETGQRYLNKNKYLAKFSCFDGLIEYVDMPWDGETPGINIDEFHDSLNRREIEAKNDQ